MAMKLRLSFSRSSGEGIHLPSGMFHIVSARDTIPRQAS
jgi:hypothetical protein